VHLCSLCFNASIFTNFEIESGKDDRVVNWAEEAPGEMRPFNQAASDMSTPYTGPSLIVMKFNVNPASKDYKRNWPSPIIYHDRCILLSLALISLNFSYFAHQQLTLQPTPGSRSILLVCPQIRIPSIQSLIAHGGFSITRSTGKPTGRIWPACRISHTTTKRGSSQATHRWTQSRCRMRWRSRGQCGSFAAGWCRRSTVLDTTGLIT